MVGAGRKSFCRGDSLGSALTYSHRWEQKLGCIKIGPQGSGFQHLAIFAPEALWDIFFLLLWKRPFRNSDNQFLKHISLNNHLPFSTFCCTCATILSPASIKSIWSELISRNKLSFPCSVPKNINLTEQNGSGHFDLHLFLHILGKKTKIPERDGGVFQMVVQNYQNNF